MADQKKTSAEIEGERITRRAALRKFGFGAGMAALMALSTDELARMAARKLQQSASDNKIANAVAMEFKNTGLVFADDPESPNTANPTPVGCDSAKVPACVPGTGTPCQKCSVCQAQAHDYCYNACKGPDGKVSQAAMNACTTPADTTFVGCVQSNC